MKTGKKNVSGGTGGNTRPGDWKCEKCGANCFSDKVRCYKCGAPRPSGAASGDTVASPTEPSDATNGNVRPGDWTCPQCGANVFASKDRCFKCGYNKRDGVQPSSTTTASTAQTNGGNGKNGRPGDWRCPSCNAMCFGSRNTCFKCGADRPANASQGGNGRRRPGDWTCPNCGSNVFASKDRCFKCNTPKPASAGVVTTPSAANTAGGNGDSKSSGQGRPGDWVCPSCGAMCFGSKSSCYKCGAPKPQGAGIHKRPGDWTCPACNVNVFASKDRCFKCNMRRPD